MIETLKNRYKDLKNIIERSTYSLLSAYPWSRVMIAETHTIDDNRQLWCWSEESFSGQVNTSFPVTLKFIDRTRGNYIRISGKAFVENNGVSIASEQEQKEGRSSLLRIEMQQVVWYFKKTGKIKFYRCQS